MSEFIQNCLYILTQGAYLHRDHTVLQVEVEKMKKLEVPMHNVESVAAFGNVMVSPGAMAGCAESGIAITFLSEGGFLRARVDAPGSGNVLLRRQQFRLADDEPISTEISREIVQGKIVNSRSVLMRSAREAETPEDEEALRKAADNLEQIQIGLAKASTRDEIRGHEGEAARSYFSVFSLMMRQQREDFRMENRSRRPPRDPVNALLSFTYALLLHDCVSGCTAAGLDPSVGYLHTDRPGRPSLALDLQEEFRSILADRFVLTLINRGQVNKEDFIVREGGSVEMSESTRRTVVSGWQKRKNEEITHPLLEQKTRIGLLPFVQARLLARRIRGELEHYPSCVLK